MAVAVDVVGAKQASASAQTLTYTGLTSGLALSSGAIVAALGFSNAAVTGVTATWGGQAMTQIGTIGTVGVGGLYLFGIINISNFGAQNLVVNWTTNTILTMAAMSFTGVNQVSTAAAFAHGVTASDTSGTSTAPAVAITTAVGNQVLAAMCANSFPPNLNSLSNNTLFLEPSTLAEGANYAAGAGSPVTLSGVLSSASNWSAVGIDIVAAGAADVLQAQIWM